MFEFKNIFLYNTHHSMVFSLDKLTNIYPSLSHTKLASLYPLHIWSLPPGSIFFNDAPISYTYQLTTHTPYIFIYSIYVTWMLSYLKPVSTTIPSLNLFCNSSTIWAHQHLGKILKDIFFLFCFLRAVWHLGRYSTEANNIHHR